MPDITICTNQDCGLIDFCWRFNAPPKLKDQSYSSFEFNANNECEMFLPMEDMTLIELQEGEMFP